MVIAKSFARIHWQNLANFGVLALEFIDVGDYDRVEQGDTLKLVDLHQALDGSDPLTVENLNQKTSFEVRHRLSPRQAEYILAGGLIPQVAQENTEDAAQAATEPRQ